MKILLRINDEGEFNTHVKKTKGMLLVNFWSNWSVQCHNNYNSMRKIMDTLSVDDAIVYIDWPHQKKLAEKLKVFGVPTLLFYFSGQEISRHSGTLSELTMRRHLVSAQKLTAIIE